MMNGHVIRMVELTAQELMFHDNENYRFDEVQIEKCAFTAPNI